GVGGGGVFAAMYHAVNHSLSKGLLFLSAGRILDAFHTKAIAEVHGIKHILPRTALFWIAGFLAITGTPPFGTFVSEFLVAQYILTSGRLLLGVVYVLLLAVIFVGMVGPFIHMSYGTSPERLGKKAHAESILQMVPLTILLLGVLIMGIAPPTRVLAVMQQAAALFGG
ncbi:MAG TPA: proton-conducting transporter membrane subunit, partial [Candidatus Ozemobacteraceae bacterium]|nr:proton-conducting transporter membrane subunit [Candidatus Ozemobacteraceae bacterium]